MPATETPTVALQGGIDSQTVAMRMILGLLLVGAAWIFASLLVPFFLALVLAIALSPVADRLQRAGLGKAWAGLICVLMVVTALSVAIGLVGYQAGSVVKGMNQHVRGFSRLADRVSRATGADRLLHSLDKTESGKGGGEGNHESRASSETARAGESDKGGTEETTPHAAAYLNELLQRGAGTIGQWLTTGLGGVLGFVGGLVIFLAYLFYMLLTRDEWIERVSESASLLGFRPRADRLAKVREEIGTFLGYLSMVALCYVAVVSLALWAIGVPQPLLWGLLAGLLEFIPYFGPMIASILPIFVSLSLGTWWQPLATVALYLGLHTVEGYVITPMVYGHAIRINPVVVLLGVLFFGWIWGPIGLAIAMPMLIILRGLVSMSPDTPALDALVAPEGEATKATS